MPLSSQWLVLRISGANFLHCWPWVTDSMWLELGEGLTNSFHGSLFRAFTNFTVVLHVNNSLTPCAWPASSWPLE